MMTVKEAAEFLSVSVHSVREMERRWHGKFFPAIRIGRSIRVPRYELIQWVKGGGIASTRKRLPVRMLNTSSRRLGKVVIRQAERGALRRK